LYLSNQGTYFNFWKSSGKVWFRSWWPQQYKHQAVKSPWREACGHRSDWKSKLECIRQNGGIHSVRAGPSRRLYRKLEIKKIWIQQTQCKINEGHADLWSSLVFGVQFDEGCANVESSSYANSVNLTNKKLIWYTEATYPQSLN